MTMAEETTRGASSGDPSADKGIPGDGPDTRGKWANKKEFLLAVTGVIVGPGALWRFPFILYFYGGVAFFIPYFLMLFFCGIPIFLLETALGQFTSEGGVTAWRKICPMFEGVGIASQVILLYQNVYNIVFLAWTLFYLYYSFKYPLPWSTCENYWNTDSCKQHLSTFANPPLSQGDSNWSIMDNITSPETNENFTDIFLDENPVPHFAEYEFWSHRMLRMSDDMFVGNVNGDLAVCLLIAWFLCYFCVFKGIKSTGKVVYFTATFPYLLLLILFFRGVTLPGAAEGLKLYLNPDFWWLARPDVWFHAVIEVIFSHASSQGVLIALGSYNKYNNNFYRDCLALCCLNVATSFFAGFAMFSVLGFLAKEMNTEVYNVIKFGPVMAFVTYIKALTMLPGSSFWAVLFLLMIFLLCVDSQFICVESFATAITDMCPRLLRRPRGREILVLIIAIVCFLFGLPFVTEGGMLLINVMYTYGKNEIILLLIAFLETIIIAWIYGADRFLSNIEDMIGYCPVLVWKYCWLFITPFFCGVTLLYNLADRFPLHLNGKRPGAGIATLGALLFMTPLIVIPIFIFVALCRNSNRMTTPSSDLRQARPNKPILTLCNKVIFRGQGKPNRSMDEGNDKMVMEEPSRV